MLRRLAAMPHQLDLSLQLLPQASVAHGIGPAIRAGRFTVTKRTLMTRHIAECPLWSDAAMSSPRLLPAEAV